MATTRLRKAFRYPDDSGDDEQSREELDEEEQDLVIRQLQAENDKRNSEYTIIFSVIPLLSATIYVPPIITSSSTLPEQLLSILSVTSLLLTAYTMKYHAMEPPDPKGKRPMKKTDPIMSVRKYAIPTNVALCALLALASIMALPTTIVTYLIPAAILATILIARKVMVSVDIRHLENLRYDYKGA
ncbi:hypothetical protein IFM46972_05347 [Aspergillus udagawae]|uniref:Uncharacterized protein n=1 Tax=Aspergillus udagawae TaxID=91492 RepID=A0A8H3RU48_9EURO|nr:hypothetical protein IFM46972_05347 [Aspergillus udagawae]